MSPSAGHLLARLLAGDDVHEEILKIWRITSTLPTGSSDGKRIRRANQSRSTASPYSKPPSSLIQSITSSWKR